MPAKKTLSYATRLNSSKMSDHFVDAAYQKKHYHDPQVGTPDMKSELEYRLIDHRGRGVILDDRQFASNYPTGTPSKKRNDYDPEMFGVKR